MSICPSCDEPVRPGETICSHCGTELVSHAPVDAAGRDNVSEGMPTADPAAHAESSAAELDPCPDCGERAPPDANGWCPVCGHDFAATARHRSPRASGATAAGRKDAQEAPASTRAPAGGVGRGPVTTDVESAAPSGAPRQSTATAGDSAQPTDGAGAGQWEPPRALEVEGGQKVFFEGEMVSEILLDVDELTIGRRDPIEGHYPDIDLTHFRDLDPHISRHHARLVRRAGTWWIEDEADNDATFVNCRERVLNLERAPLRDGDRVIISDSLALRLVPAQRNGS